VADRSGSVRAKVYQPRRADALEHGQTLFVRFGRMGGGRDSERADVV